MTTRRCSHCGHNGHNARTCLQRGVKIFGVRLVAGSNHAPAMTNFKTSFSTENLNNSNSSNSADQSESSALAADYASDTVVAKRRKKGVPWSEEEHRMFLVGLRAMGKGDWRAISRNFVPTRTPTQVASHAQKYFLRQSNPLKRKRRSSLFDIPQGVVFQGSTGLAGILESNGGFSMEEVMRYGGGFCGVSSSTRMPPVLAVVDRLAENGRLRLSIAPPSPLAEAPAANLAVNLGSSSGSLIRVV